jgi:diguanylate cyclase (GGDEF)-like protein/PAS domain S-box-containing protein
VGIPVIVAVRSDEPVTFINSALRDSGHPVHCTRVSDAASLEAAIESRTPELLLLFDRDTELDLPACVTALGRCSPPPPVVLVQERVDESAIAAAMAAGARDVVSMGHRNRLQAVIGRELHAHRLRVALEGVVSSARQYKQELRSLMTDASEAIADIQEGIIVTTNPAWAQLFGYGSDEELIGQPFMDFYRDADQPTLKGALVACLRGKWQEAETLAVVARRHDGDELPLEMCLKRVTVDGEPAVRAMVRVERAAESPPEELLEQAVSKDPSTGFFHRHYFLERMAEQLKRQPAGGIRAVAYIRPDHFARVQTDIGLLGTDAILMRFAGLLRDMMHPGDLYGRFGGTMFAVLLERGTMTDAQAWAEHIRKSVASQVFEVDAHSTSLTCTIGLCEVRSPDQDPGALLTEAEQACRTGRDQGGNRVVLSTLTSETEKVRKTDALWVSRIRAALMQNRLRLVHQPVVGLQEEIQGVLDTRVRMVDEQGEVVLPSDFIPPAERAHLMKNIDRWIIGATFSFCSARNPNLVFVRLSKDSVLDSSLLEWLRARATNARLRAGQVCFQVSEELVLQHLKQVKDLAVNLRQAGFLFAVDHFGTGRESIQLLDHLPMNFVKVDGSLMQGLSRDRDLQQRVGSIASRARELKVKAIAERVENASTMAVLWQLGVPLIQGNFTQNHSVVLEDSATTEQQATG